MIIGYFVIFLISLGLFFMMGKSEFLPRLSISILVFMIFATLFTIVVLKMAAAPTPGKKYTLEQWKEKNKKKEVQKTISDKKGILEKREEKKRQTPFKGK